MSYYLCIDFGEKNLGFAVGESMLATPVGTLKYDSTATAITHIGKLIADHQVTDIVLGLPDGPVAIQVQTFGEVLAKEFSLPIVYHPETLSTKQAKSSLLATGSRSKRAHDHAYAACLILEDYLEVLGNS